MNVRKRVSIKYKCASGKNNKGEEVEASMSEWIRNQTAERQVQWIPFNHAIYWLFIFLFTLSFQQTPFIEHLYDFWRTRRL